MEKFYGGSGNGSLYSALYSRQALHNDTEEEYEIHSSYSTVANGSAEHIVVPPGQAIVKLSVGGPRDFSCWGVGTVEEVTAKGYEMRSLAQMMDFAASHKGE